MKYTLCTLLLFAAAPAMAQQSLKHDFRGGKFDRDVLAYSGQTPEQYFTPEKEGLRLRYSGGNAPPSYNTAGIVYRFHARGDFVVTARYEILTAERPKPPGWAVGAELYLRVKNPNKDGISLSRIVHVGGATKVSFSYLTYNDQKKRVPKDSKEIETTDRSLRGAFRLAREGTDLIASFAEADDDFKEFQRTDMGNADIDLIRFAGLGGGDPNAVLDMRMLEFDLSGKDLGHDGRGFTTPAPKADIPAVNAEAPVAPPAVQGVPVGAEPPPTAKGNLLLLVAIFFMLVIPLILISAAVLFVRLRKSKADNSDAQGKISTAIKKKAKPKPASRSERTP